MPPIRLSGRNKRCAVCNHTTSSTDEVSIFSIGSGEYFCCDKHYMIYKQMADLLNVRELPAGTFNPADYSSPQAEKGKDDTNNDRSSSGYRDIPDN